MIKVSDSARDQVAKLKKLEEMPANSFIRVGVKSGGCSGLSYDLTFDTTLQENDQEFEDNDVKVVVEKKSLLYLAGTTLEYEGGLNGKGFSFNNPNASRTCGCGESFAV
ncbi:MAG: iron-sulfur cluster assembly accessory protein [Flavobacteriales bacterium]|nr:iron-sulfur cluster assembly accessory protein [Flavobacteriales bacterium]|tara:strand:+ start:272 stop:598 length:327 start_codon:yes stop_codon:yes gene_type:complete